MLIFEASLIVEFLFVFPVIAYPYPAHFHFTESTRSMNTLWFDLNL